MLNKVILEGDLYGTAWSLCYMAGEDEEAILTIELNNLQNGCVLTDVIEESQIWWSLAPETKDHCRGCIDVNKEESLLQLGLVISRTTPSWLYKVASVLVASLCHHIQRNEYMALITRGRAILKEINDIKASGLLASASFDEDLFGGDDGTPEWGEYIPSKLNGGK